MEKYEITPLNRKSFYGKCHVQDDGETAELISYGTKVAEYSFETGKVKVHGWYSHTTARHINAFLNHFGFEAVTKKEMDDSKYWENLPPIK